MITLDVKDASDKLPVLVENAITKHEPVLIASKNNNAILMAEGDWRAVNETLHLLSAPGMRDTIQNGLSENLQSTSRKLNW